MANRTDIFVTVGSTDFDALTEAVDDLVPALQLQGVMQIGHGRYIPVNLPYSKQPMKPHTAPPEIYFGRHSMAYFYSIKIYFNCQVFVSSLTNTLI